jgi:hypothetical protein
LGEELLKITPGLSKKYGALAPGYVGQQGPSKISGTVALTCHIKKPNGKDSGVRQSLNQDI